MTASFNLTLDTRAPGLQWGPVTDPNAGEVMSIAYEVDEPGLVSAEVVLRDGRALPMEIGPQLLTVELPDNAPEGRAVVRATTRDDVWNEAVYSLNVLVTGVPFVEPAPYVPPVGGPPVVKPVLIVDEPSRAAASSTYTTTAVLTSTSRTRTRSTYASPGYRVKYGGVRRLRALTGPDQLLVMVADSSTARTRSGFHSNGQETDRIARRPEGPDTEAALIALGLL